MSIYSSRAYLVGSPALRDRLIAELAAAGVAAAPGPDVPVAAWSEAGYRPRLGGSRPSSVEAFHPHPNPLPSRERESRYCSPR